MPSNPEFLRGFRGWGGKKKKGAERRTQPRRSMTRGRVLGYYLCGYSTAVDLT